MAALPTRGGFDEWTGAIGHSARLVFPPGLLLLPCAVAPLLGARRMASELSTHDFGLAWFTMPAMCGRC
jgi:hypothetical protein